MFKERQRQHADYKACRQIFNSNSQVAVSFLESLKTSLFIILLLLSDDWIHDSVSSGNLEEPDDTYDPLHKVKPKHSSAILFHKILALFLDLGFSEHQERETGRGKKQKKTTASKGKNTSTTSSSIGPPAKKIKLVKKGRCAVDPYAPTDMQQNVRTLMST